MAQNIHQPVSLNEVDKQRFTGIGFFKKDDSNSGYELSRDSIKSVCAVGLN
jgi:hypothetical protein